MRIDSNLPLTPIPDPERRAAATGRNEAPPTDQIQLSSAAGSAIDTQSEKIATIRAQVASGTYRVSSEAIAGSIIDEMTSSS